MSFRTKLTIAYLGGPFHGWQRQPNRRTVQGELERALTSMTGGLEVTVVGAGRTDAGVHAAAQVAHLDLPVRIPAHGLVSGLNHHLPGEIRVRAARPVPGSFHARRDALAKHYTYRARWREPSLPWLGIRVATVPEIEDHDALADALGLLEGRHDVASFTVPEAAVGSTERTLYQARLEARPNGIDLRFVGDGFLRYQVRRMAGALLEVGRLRMTLEAFQDLLERPTPGAPIPAAPARGLTLERVRYGTLAGLEGH